MNEKEFDLDVFENADDETAKKIAAYCPASDEEKERMFAMSRKIYNERTKESDNKETMEVSGVERYNKPVWQKIMSAAAVLVIMAGIGTGGALMLKNHNKPPQTTLPVSPATTTEAESKAISPFGDLDGYEVKIKHPDYDELVTMSQELSGNLIKAFNEGEWTQLPNDTEPDPAAQTALHVVLTKDDVSMYFMLYGDKYILCDKGTEQTKWEVGEDIKNAVYSACSAAMASIDRNHAQEKYLAEEAEKVKEAEDTEFSADAFEMLDIPDTEFMQKDLAADMLKECGFNVEFVNKESNDIQPGYIITSKPAPGEQIIKGTLVILYVSSGAEPAIMATDDYIGMDIDDAGAMASYRSLKVLYEYVDSPEKYNIVVGQKPQSGEEIETGTEIIFYVSNGALAE